MRRLNKKKGKKKKAKDVMISAIRKLTVNVLCIQPLEDVHTNQKWNI